MKEIIRSSDKKEWLDIRRKGIGGSDISAICGFNAYRSPVDVFMDKTGASAPIEDNEAMYWGRTLEDVVAKEFQARTGLKVQRFNATIKDGFMVANIDRAIVNPSIAGDVKWSKTRDALTTDSILECKTASLRNAWKWGKSQLEEILSGGKVETEAEIPAEYLCQVQWYMSLTGTAFCYVAVLIGGNDFRVFLVSKNQEFIDFLEEKASKFWEKVEAGEIPEPTTAKEALQVFHKDNGQSKECDNSTAAAVSDLISAKARMKEVSAEVEAAETALKLFIGEATELTLGGDKIATWKAQTRKTLDSKRLKEEMPEVFKDFQKESSTRVFRFTATAD